MLEERRRLLQDLHDGMGHELLGALLLARSQEATRDAVTAQIERALDHLKLTVDALQPGDHDIGSVLASLRHRLARRLECAGVVLEWRVQRLPPIAGWDANRARELQLLMYEGFTNLIQHSGATRAQMEAGLAAGGRCVALRLRDDGCGLRPSASHGHGIASMRARASRLGGSLAFARGNVRYPGAALELRIPMPGAPARSVQGRTWMSPVCMPSNTASPRDFTCSLR